MIKITVTMDGDADLDKFSRNLKRNILHSQTQLAKEVTEEAMYWVKEFAPVWRGTLKDAVSMLVFPKSHRGEVFISGDWMMQKKAWENEYGLSSPEVRSRSETPELDEWALDKGYVNRFDPDLVLVGGANTRLGTTNVFFRHAFREVRRELPNIAGEVITKAISHTRG